MGAARELRPCAGWSGAGAGIARVTGLAREGDRAEGVDARGGRVGRLEVSRGVRAARGLGCVRAGVGRGGCLGSRRWEAARSRAGSCRVGEGTGWLEGSRRGACLGRVRSWVRRTARMGGLELHVSRSDRWRVAEPVAVTVGACLDATVPAAARTVGRRLTGSLVPLPGGLGRRPGTMGTGSCGACPGRRPPSSTAVPAVTTRSGPGRRTSWSGPPMRPGPSPTGGTGTGPAGTRGPGGGRPGAGDPSLLSCQTPARLRAGSAATSRRRTSPPCTP